MRELKIGNQIKATNKPFVRPSNMTEGGVHNLIKGEKPLPPQALIGSPYTTNEEEIYDKENPKILYKVNPYVEPKKEKKVELKIKSKASVPVYKESGLDKLKDLFTKKPKAKYTTGRGENFRMKKL